MSSPRFVAEDIVPRLLASPAQSPEQVAAAAIAALQPAETAVLAEDAVESTLELFDEIFEVVTVEGSQRALPTASSAAVLGSVDPYVFKAAAGPLARVAQRDTEARNAGRASIAAMPDTGEICAQDIELVKKQLLQAMSSYSRGATSVSGREEYWGILGKRYIGSYILSRGVQPLHLKPVRKPQLHRKTHGKDVSLCR